MSLDDGFWLILLQSEKQLDREKGLQQLQQQVKDGGLAEEKRRESEREVVSPLLPYITEGI